MTVPTVWNLVERAPVLAVSSIGPTDRWSDDGTELEREHGVSVAATRASSVVDIPGC
jgi:hypothetical protein